MESRKRGLDPREGEAIVIAGNKEALESILSDFKFEGIPIRTSRLYAELVESEIKPISRDLYFDPSSNNLKVRTY
jgi:hypothetical protein